jgi:hypothetical protein
MPLIARVLAVAVAVAVVVALVVCTELQFVTAGALGIEFDAPLLDGKGPLTVRALLDDVRTSPPLSVPSSSQRTPLPAAPSSLLSVGTRHHATGHRAQQLTRCGH